MPVEKSAADGVLIRSQGGMADDGGILGVLNHSLHGALVQVHGVSRPEDTGFAHAGLEMDPAVSEDVVAAHREKAVGVCCQPPRPQQHVGSALARAATAKDSLRTPPPEAAAQDKDKNDNQ